MKFRADRGRISPIRPFIPGLLTSAGAMAVCYLMNVGNIVVRAATAISGNGTGRRCGRSRPAGRPPAAGCVGHGAALRQQYGAALGQQYCLLRLELR
jgi:hypothetical protein